MRSVCVLTVKFMFKSRQERLSINFDNFTGFMLSVVLSSRKNFEEDCVNSHANSRFNLRGK